MTSRFSRTLVLAFSLFISNCGTELDPASLVAVPLTEFDPIVETASIGTLPASADVTQDGTFQYTLPIVVPPGRAGMTPQLAIRYTSGGAETSLGIGFALDGLSSISRCPRTFAQDGERRGVELNEDDRFCVDGARLVATPGSTYGSAGAVYRVETDPLVRVTELSRTVDGSQPNGFLIELPDGRERRYGFSLDSRVAVPTDGSAVFATWLLTEERDAAGNTMTYVWEQVAPDPVEFGGGGTPEAAVGNLARISEIRYTGFTSATASVEGTRSVRFTYSASKRRLGAGAAFGSNALVSPPNPEDLFRFGVRWWRASVFPLQRIETFVDDAIVHRYVLHGSDDPVTLQHRLSAIELCTNAPEFESEHHTPLTTADGLVCIPATHFAWRQRAVPSRDGEEDEDDQRDPRARV